MSGRSRVSPLLVGCVLVGGLVGGLATGCGSDERSGAAALTSGPADRLVLVSGRDDHGMVAEEQVPVYDAPDGHRVVGRVADATLARVLETDGTWLHVRTAEGAHRVTGWVDDFFLRGELRLVGPAPSCAARLGGAPLAGGTLVVVRDLDGDRARVETVAGPGTTGWVDRSVLQELPPQGRDCGDIPPDDRHAH